MPLIFDRFGSDDAAQQFVSAIADVAPELETWIYYDEQAAQQLAIFPGALEPIIVLVERADQGDDSAIERVRELGGAADGFLTGAEIEAQLEQLVEQHGGVFVGT